MSIYPFQFCLVEYPCPPANLALQELPTNNSSLLHLTWPLTTPTAQRASAEPITAYHVYLNKKIQIATVPVTDLILLSKGMAAIELDRKHFEINQEDLIDIAHPLSLTVQSSTETNTSCHSSEVAIPTSVLRRLFPFLLDSSNDYPDSSQPSEVSVMSTNTSGDKTSFTDSNSQSQLEDEEGVNEGEWVGFC